MKTVSTDKSRQELFNNEQVNDNYAPATASDYENIETVTYELDDGDAETFPHFCFLRISRSSKEYIRIIYNTGTIIITGRNLEALERRIASKKLAAIRVTSPSAENEDEFVIDSITFKES